jgi:DNA-binding response OmpR family regulator
MASAKSVLLVEDDDSVRLTLRDYLQRKGHDVLVASDGVGAIRILVDQDVGAVVTDFRMDLLGGDYWIRFLRKFCPDLPVFVMSGFLDPETDIPYPCFTKPFEFDVLHQRLLEVLSPQGGGDQSSGTP